MDTFVLPQSYRGKFRSFQYFPFRFLGFAEKLSNKVKRGILATDSCVFSFDPTDGTIRRSIPTDQIACVHTCFAKHEVAICARATDGEATRALAVRTRSMAALESLIRVLPLCIPRNDWEGSLTSPEVVKEASFTIDDDEGSAVHGVRWEVQPSRGRAASQDCTGEFELIDGRSLSWLTETDEFDTMDDIDFSSFPWTGTARSLQEVK
jgi:hypothetical protein